MYEVQARVAAAAVLVLTPGYGDAYYAHMGVAVEPH